MSIKEILPIIRSIMIFKPSEFFKILKKNDIDFFCGVQIFY